MIRHKNRPATIINAVPPKGESWYKIATENGKEMVPESELQFDTKADIDKFNKDYNAHIDTDVSLDKTLDKEVLKDVKTTDKIKEKEAKAK